MININNIRFPISNFNCFSKTSIPCKAVAILAKQMQTILTYVSPLILVNVSLCCYLAPGRSNQFTPQLSFTFFVVFSSCFAGFLFL